MVTTSDDADDDDGLAEALLVLELVPVPMVATKWCKAFANKNRGCSGVRCVKSACNISSCDVYHAVIVVAAVIFFCP